MSKIKYTTFLLLGFIFSIAALLFNFNFKDFSLYWAASSLFHQGKNSYDETLIASFLSSELTAGVWNPPWLFLLLSPFTQMSLKSAGGLMLFVNIIVLIKTFDEVKKALNCKISSFAISMSFLGSVTLLSNLILGQLGIILAFCVLKSWNAFQEKKDVQALLWLVALTVKPHVGFCISLYIVLRTLKTRAYLAFLPPAGVLCLLIFFSFFINSQATTLWFSGNVYPHKWVGSTFSAFLTEYYLAHDLSGSVVRSAPFILSALSALLVSYLALSNYNKLSSQNLLMTLVLGSIFFAPYGFFFDHSPLVIILYYLGALFESLNPTRIQKLLCLSLTFLIGWGILLFPESLFSLRKFYILHPFLIAALWVFARSSKFDKYCSDPLNTR